MSSAPCFRTPVFVSLALTLACGSTQATTRGRTMFAGQSRAVLTEGEIGGASARTALDVIRRLRPEYLAFTRRNGLGDEVAVYVDGIRLGTVEALGNISATNVREVRRLDARDATTRFGTGHTAGAILILTKSGP